MESTRLPRKLLLSETGKTLIEHTWSAARSSKLADQIVVATDSEEIFAAVEKFGGDAVMTAKTHQSGSDRVAEACRNIDADIIINLQGDEPETKGEFLDQLIVRLTQDDAIDVATLACPILSYPDLLDPSRVKVVMNHFRQALYFSRSPIPGAKTPLELQSHFDQTSKTPDGPGAASFLQHLGILRFSKSQSVANSWTSKQQVGRN